MFLKRAGNIAWQYNCHDFHSPLQIPNKCIKTIPILCEDEILIFDAISKKTFTEALEQLCTEKHSDLIQLDVDDDNSLVELAHR